MTLIHKDYHIPQIRTGGKTETRREWKENYAGPRIGSIQMAVSAGMLPEGTSPIHARDEDCDCYVQVQEKYRQPLGEMTDENARAEGDYENVDEYREEYERVYGDDAWAPEKEVTVVGYEYVGRERPDTATRIAGCPNCGPSEFDVAVATMGAYIRGGAGAEVVICEYHRDEMNAEAREYRESKQDSE